MIKIITSLFLFVSLASFAQEKEIKVDSKITEVLVYLNGASVHRQASVSIGAGRTKLKFSGLPVGIDANSIQAALTGNGSGSSLFSYSFLPSNFSPRSRLPLDPSSMRPGNSPSTISRG